MRIFQGVFPCECNLKVNSHKCLFIYHGIFFGWSAPESSFTFMSFSEFVKWRKVLERLEIFVFLLDFKRFVKLDFKIFVKSVSIYCLDSAELMSGFSLLENMFSYRQKNWRFSHDKSCRYLCFTLRMAGFCAVWTGGFFPLYLPAFLIVWTYASFDKLIVWTYASFDFA